VKIIGAKDEGLNVGDTLFFILGIDDVKIGELVGENVRVDVWDCVGKSVGNAVGPIVRDKVGEKVGYGEGEKVGD